MANTILKTAKTAPKLLDDGTLVINTDLYPDVKRVLVEHGTSGTLYYADGDAEHRSCENCCSGDQKEKAKICQRSYITGMEHRILCADCRNFNKKDNYCKVLQINWLPENFGCNKGRNR